MKDKILNAIDKGLMNVLSTDIEDQDIDFDTNDIDNEYIPEISLDELYGMFKKDPESIFNKKYDTTNAVSLILDGNSEIPLCHYEEGMNPVFLKISNDDLKSSDNEILIYIPNNHLISEQPLNWATSMKQIQSNTYLINYKNYKSDEKIVVSKDFSGYKNCKRISDIAKRRMEELPTINYCMKQNIYGHQGYLPSMGQLIKMYIYLDLINFVLHKVGSKNILNLKASLWWSSNERDTENTWILTNGRIGNYYKITQLNVLPIFTLKNIEYWHER